MVEEEAELSDGEHREALEWIFVAWAIEGLTAGDQIEQKNR